VIAPRPLVAMPRGGTATPGGCGGSDRGAISDLLRLQGTPRILSGEHVYLGSKIRRAFARKGVAIDRTARG
jgi:hypothetical protein